MGLGRQQRRSKDVGPITHTGNPDGVQAPGPAWTSLAVAALWEDDQQMEACVSACPHLYCSAFQNKQTEL